MSSRVWVITGASSGLGLAMSRHIAKQGDKVIATVRSLAKFPAELKDAGAVPLELDLDGSDESIQEAAEKAIKIYGHVDVLVNNAGVLTVGYGPIEETSLKAIRAAFQSNVFGAIAFSQPFIAHFRQRRAGHIINVSSLAAPLNPPAWGAYCAAKNALESFSSVLSKELALFNVRVTILMPGYYPTKIWGPRSDAEASASEAKPAAAVTTVYTDPSQGYNNLTYLRDNNEKSGVVGDPDKLAERVYELGAGVGLVKRVLDEHASKGWIRVPGGSDTAWVVQTTADLLENYKAYEPIWSSTNRAA